MAQPPLSCSWRPDSLRPFESVGSFGAKYCYLNKITFREFGLVLTELLPDGTTIPYGRSTLDMIGFNIEGLARLLDEPLALVHSLSLKKSRLGPHLGTLCLSKYNSEFNFRELRFCPACMASGYHSNLHQLEWIDKCFIHGCSLNHEYDHAPSLSNLGMETRLIQPLYIRWFKPERLRFKADIFWPEAKYPSWAFDDCRLIQQSAQSALSKLRTLENRLAVTAYHPPRLIGGPTGARVVMAMNMVGIRSKSVFDLLNKEKLTLKKARNFICSREEAAAILDIDDHDLSLLMHGRQVMCAISELRPRWRVTLEELKRRLVSGHENCLKLVHESTLSAERVRLGNTNYYVQAPFNRELFHSVPCNRIVTLNFLQILLDIEEEDPLSHVRVSELSRGSKHWMRLISLGLLSEVSGFIPRDGHQLFGSNNQYLQANGSHEDHLRWCEVFAPSGVLAQMIDEMILAHAWSWCWALFSMEQQAGQLVDPRNYPDRFLEKETARLSPIFSIQQNTLGLTLKIGTFVKYKSPPWKTCLGNKKAHAQEVAQIYNFRIDHFNEEVSKGWDHMTRLQTKLYYQVIWRLACGDH
jgi:hypothetical protein